MVKALFGDNSLPEESLTFTVILHFATALSTLVVFRKEVGEILSGLFQFKWNEELQFSLKVIVSMLPAMFIGVLFEEQLESFFGGKILLVGFMLLVTALLLLLADKAKNTNKNVSYSNAFIVGISQAIAMLAGNFKIRSNDLHFCVIRHRPNKSSTFFIFNGCTFNFRKSSQRYFGRWY